VVVPLLGEIEVAHPLSLALNCGDVNSRKDAEEFFLSVHGSDDPNIPAAPIPDPGGVRDGRGTPVDSRTPPPVARTGSRFQTSNLRLMVLGLVVLVLVVAILVGSRG
jgi:hypothetical protein